MATFHIGVMVKPKGEIVNLCTVEKSNLKEAKKEAEEIVESMDLEDHRVYINRRRVKWL